MLKLSRFATGMQITGHIRNAVFAMRQMSKGTKPPEKGPPPKGAAPKDPPKSPEKKKQDETAIRGGSKCSPKNKSAGAPAPGAVKKSCDDLLNKKSGKKKKQKLTAIQGGGQCGQKRKESAHSGGGMKLWRSISLFAILPMVAILTLLVFSTHKEHEHPEFVYYPFMYKRTKTYYFKDGNRTLFHNSKQNALPPAGYEDEIDEGGIGQEPETEKDKKQRLSDFQKLLKDWKKHAGAESAAAE
ncbi:uncharacterized protein [Drosophila pseudoobscura]|uniref:Uncharacterized protein n=1 Tax=Drosophila pseudoobscura pseudoobscura TaxID=46245 RepID=A0A6I8UWV4_DROPS|nr:uncharacterized protein LOC6903351 [Drosophila pseudoobscura]